MAISPALITAREDFGRLPAPVAQRVLASPRLVEAQTMFRESRAPSISNNKFWTMAGEEYEENVGFFHPYSNVLVDFSFTLVERKAKSVLDVGCGSGKLLRWFNEFKYMGVDICEANAKLLKETFPWAEVHVGDFLDFKTDKKFDSAMLAGILLYLSPAQQALALHKVYSMTTPEMIMLLQLNYSQGASLAYFNPRNSQGDAMPNWAFEADEEYLNELVKACGFRTMKVTYGGTFGLQPEKGEEILNIFGIAEKDPEYNSIQD